MTDEYKLSQAEEEEVHRNFAALGEFIAMCSQLESVLHMCLREWLAIDEAIERMLVGEPRMGELLDLVKKAARRAGYAGERYAFIETLTTIASENNKIRQIVAHKHMERVGMGLMMFHNTETAKSESARINFQCTTEELLNQASLIHECSHCWVDCMALRDETQATQAAILTMRKQLASLQSNPLPAIPGQPLPPKSPAPKRQRPPSQG